MIEVLFGPSADIPGIRALREGLYSLDGVVLSAAESGEDLDSWHIVSRMGGKVAACLRYRPGPEAWGRPTAVVGAWASVGARHSIRVLRACYELGFLHGGVLAFATATVRHGSAAVLERMGGEVLAEYVDPERGPMRLLVFDTALPAPGPSR